MGEIMIDLRLAEAIMATRVGPKHQHHALVRSKDKAGLQSQEWLSLQARRLLRFTGHKLRAWGERLEQYGLPHGMPGNHTDSVPYFEEV
jgi:hypothetical protein